MVRVARGLIARTRGLIGSDGSFALLIPRCNWIHTWFMSYPLDVYYLDRRGEVVKKVTVAPGRFTRPVRGATAVLEVPAGLDGEVVLKACGGLWPEN